MPTFPRSAEYLEFYRRLTQELRRRNLKLLMQMTDGFRETAFSALPVELYYRGLTWERYRREKRQMAETIINGDFVSERAFRFAEIAQRAGKRLVLGEAWLYKAAPDQTLRGRV